MAITKNAVIFSMMVVALCFGVTVARIAPTPQEAVEETNDLPTTNTIERQVVLIPGESDCDSAPDGTEAAKVVQIPQEEADCDSEPEVTNDDIPTHAINNVERQQVVLLPGDGDCDSAAPTGAQAIKIVPTPPKKTQIPQEEADCDSAAPDGAQAIKIVPTPPKKTQIPQEEADCDSEPEVTNDDIPTHAINNVERQQVVLLPGDGDCDSAAPTGAQAIKIVPTPPKKTQIPQEEADCDSAAPDGAQAIKIVPTPPKKTQIPQEEADCDSAPVPPTKVTKGQPTFVRF